MTVAHIKDCPSTHSLKTLFTQYLVTMTLAFGFALLIHNAWVRYLDVYHTILELICIFIALSICLSVWYTYHRNSANTAILGFGYLTIAIFDALHTFYFLKLDLTLGSYFDLSTRYWILGRLTEATVLFLSVQPLSIKTNKWAALLSTLALASGLSFFVVKYHDYLPILLTEQGVTPIKTALEYVVIFIYLISLYRLKDKLKDKGVITYRYIFISLLMSIPSEFCFTLYTSVNSISWTIGHILKITSYYFLFKGIFSSTVTYSYERLEIEHKKLEKANEELNNISETLNDLLDALPIGVQKYDQNVRLKYVNKKFEELLACDRNDLYGLTPEELLKIFSGAEQDSIRFSHESPETEEGMKNIPRIYKTLKGNIIKLSIDVQKIRNGYLVLMHDTKKDQALKNLHIQTETILNAVNNCVLMIDNNKKVILCNKALENLFEADKKDIIGMDIDELNKRINFGAKELPDLVLQGDTEKQLYEVSLTSLKGNPKQILLYLASIKNVDGESIGGISVSTDITELKLEQQKILHQEKLALLGQMGAGIVHETRNYLTTIKGRCQLMSLQTQDEALKKHTSKIDSDIDEINRIISEFLFLSKPREAEIVEVSLYDMLASIEGMVKTSSLVKGIQVDFGLCTAERYLLCDEGQVKQVILNMCKNAIDAMTDIENALLKIETGYDDASNEMFIRIKDNGCGISEEDLKKIGTPFFTTKKSGTGLGLNVCYKIIQEHGGRIEVESKKGVGTTFTIVLPCIEDELPDEMI